MGGKGKTIAYTNMVQPEHLERTNEWFFAKTILEPQRAKRSGASYFDHVREGACIINALEKRDGQSYFMAKRAYTIHPLVQRTEDLVKNFGIIANFDPTVVALALEYRWVANLGTRQKVRESGGKIMVSALPLVNVMLIADKIQNRKAFLATYPESDKSNYEELDDYFRLWLRILGISEREYEKLVKDASGCDEKS